MSLISGLFDSEEKEDEERIVIICVVAHIIGKLVELGMYNVHCILLYKTAVPIVEMKGLKIGHKLCFLFIILLNKVINRLGE